MGTRSVACPDLSRVHWPGAGCSAARWRRPSPCKFLGTWKPSQRIWWMSDWSPPMWNQGWQQTRGWLGRYRPLSPARSRCRPWRAWRWWAGCCPVPTWGGSRGCTWVGGALRSGKGAGAQKRRQQKRLPLLLPCTCTDRGTNCQTETWQCPVEKRRDRVWATKLV